MIDYTQNSSGESKSSDQKGSQSFSTTAEYKLPISLEEVLIGGEKNIRINRKVLDADGKETNQTKELLIQIKPGLIEGTRIEFPGEGDYVSGIATDIVFIIEDKPHPIFKRINNCDLLYHLLETEESILNGQYPAEIPTLDGEPISVYLTAPIETEEYREWKISGHGLPVLEHDDALQQKRGDILVRQLI